MTFDPSIQNKWPAERGLDVYQEMAGELFTENLDEDSVWMDIGPGASCRALREFSDRSDKKMTLIATAPNFPQEVPRSVLFLGGWTPSFELPMRVQADCITDIFSCMSYCLMPNSLGKLAPGGLYAMIRVAGWLSSKGRLFVCTEVGRFGNQWDMARITRFFNKRMGLDCQFTVYRKLAEGNGVWEDQLRVVIKKTKTYASLCLKAEEIVGRELRGRVLWESRDGGKAKIFEVLYPGALYFARNCEELASRFKMRSITYERPEWPDTRDKKAYVEMIGFDPGEFLKDGDVYIDAGAGRKCRVVGEIAAQRPNVKCIALGLHLPEELPQGVVFIRGCLPEYSFDRIPPANLITCIYGPTSFADELIPGSEDQWQPAALKTMIRLAMQLAPGGKLIVCTEYDRFGDEHAWKRIANFFTKEMGLYCRFEPYRHFAEDRQIEETQLRIVIENHQTYEELIRLADTEVGIPTCGRALWESREEDPEKRMRIMETVFEHPTPLSSKQFSPNKRART